MNDECVLHECAVALLLIDVINDLEFDEGGARIRPERHGTESAWQKEKIKKSY